MASVVSQLIGEVTAHAQSDSLEDAREICAEGTYFPNNLRTLSRKKYIGLIFRTSCSGSDVRYSCHHNSSRFTFPIFVHSWRFSVFHSLQSITPRLY